MLLIIDAILNMFGIIVGMYYIFTKNKGPDPKNREGVGIFLIIVSGMMKYIREWYNVPAFLLMIAVFFIVGFCTILLGKGCDD